jgi:anti-sigma regulatory factor (Ser/Thr protein kinase)
MRSDHTVLACRDPRPGAGNWRERAVQAGGELFSINYGVSPGTPRMARSMVRYILSEWQVGSDAILTAELLASELVTNAVRFGFPCPPRYRVPQVTLAIRYAVGLVVLEVTDENEKPPEPSPPDPDSEQGRGLTLVTELSREWSWYYPRPGAKTVYCVIAEQSEP